MRHIFLMLPLALMPPMASASNWVSLDSTTKVDSSSIVRKREYVKAWIILPDNSYEKSAYLPSSVYAKSQIFIRCRERSMATKQMLYYDAQWQFMGESVTPSKAISFNDVAPDTVGEYIVDFVCHGKRPAQVDYASDFATLADKYGKHKDAPLAASNVSQSKMLHDLDAMPSKDDIAPAPVKR